MKNTKNLNQNTFAKNTKFIAPNLCVNSSKLSKFTYLKFGLNEVLLFIGEVV